MFNLTKRQLLCFGAAVAIGLPLFFLTDVYKRQLFVRFPIVKLAAALSRSSVTVKRSLNELEDAGLILRVRRGVGEQNRIYTLLQMCIRDRHYGGGPQSALYRQAEGQPHNKGTYP